MECPSLIYGARRGPIACVATNTDYSLLHLEIGGIIPLFPILSSNLSPSVEVSPSAPVQEEPEEASPRPGRKPSLSPKPPSASEASDTEGSTHEKTAGIRAVSKIVSRAHPARSTSLQQRPRSEVLPGGAPSALSVPDDGASKHTRASSTGSIQRRLSGSIGRNSPLSRSMGRTAGKDAMHEIIADRKSTPSPTPSASGTSRVKSPNTTISKSSKLPIQSGGASRSTTSSRTQTPNPTPPGSATSSHPTKTRSSKPPMKLDPSTQASLNPHIVSPTPNEFLLITGTSPVDPGVGMFVNNDGDPTRGTIQLTKYPEEIVLDGGCIIALLPASDKASDNSTRLLETISIQEDDSNSSTLGGFIEVTLSVPTAKIGIARVMGLQEVAVPEVASRLRFNRVRLLMNEHVTPADPQEWEIKRVTEEQEAAIRISKIGGKVVLFNGKKVWRLLPSPMAVQLDSRLPIPLLASKESTPGTRKEADKRRAAILSVLKAVHGLEPTTERMFHEIAYIKQKCGILLLAEFLNLPREEDKRQFPTELLATELALIDGSLDPRIVVSLFSGFEEELREGTIGVWVYGGIKEVIDAVLSNRRLQEQPRQSYDEGKEPEWSGRRDLLLLLRRYLSAWRQKKGFGSVSQADEKEVFWTIDAALMRCLLLLEATRSPSAQQHMAGEVDVRQELYKICDYPSSVECFDRCVYLLEKFKRLYVLSILYQSRKMSREVLETWKRLFESGDEKALAEFGEGEDRIADYLLSKKDRELVREYGLWLANRNQKLGIKVFADERARVKWDVQEVLDMFKEHAPIALKGYVEFLVVEQKVSPPSPFNNL